MIVVVAVAGKESWTKKKMVTVGICEKRGRKEMKGGRDR